MIDPSSSSAGGAKYPSLSSTTLEGVTTKLDSTDNYIPYYNQQLPERYTGGRRQRRIRGVRVVAGPHPTAHSRRRVHFHTTTGGLDAGSTAWCRSRSVTPVPTTRLHRAISTVAGFRARRHGRTSATSATGHGVASRHGRIRSYC